MTAEGTTESAPTVRPAAGRRTSGCAPLQADLRWDLSCGVYIYHWPVQLLLALVGATAIGAAGFVVLSIAVTSALASVSWLAVEAPALRAKDAAWSPRAAEASRLRSRG